MNKINWMCYNPMWNILYTAKKYIRKSSIQARFNEFIPAYNVLTYKLENLKQQFDENFKHC